MSKIPQLSQTGDKQQGEDTTNWKLCIFCLSDEAKKGPLILKPRLDTYQKVLDTVQLRASLNDGDYVEVQRRLRDINKDTLWEQKALWHRSCYSNATNSELIQRARTHHEQALSLEFFPSKGRGRRAGSTKRDVPEGPGISTADQIIPFTRSSTVPLDKNLCFFCQEDTEEEIIRLCTENAGKELKDAIDKSQNPVFRTRLHKYLTNRCPCNRRHIPQIMLEKTCISCQP